MECKVIIDKLYPFLDNELPISEKAEVEAHLTKCDTCRKLFEQERNVEKKIVDLISVEDKAVWARAWDTFTTKAQRAQSFSAYWKRWLPAASAAVVLIALSVIFLLPVYHSQDLLGAIENEHQGFISGKTIPSIVTSSVDEINKYLQEKHQTSVCDCCLDCFRNKSLKVIGGRVCRLPEAGNTPCFYARYQDTPVSFYIINKPAIKIQGVSLESAGTLEGYETTKSGFNFGIIKTGKHYVCVIGKVNLQDLSDLIRPLVDSKCNCKD